METGIKDDKHDGATVDTLASVAEKLEEEYRDYRIQDNLLVYRNVMIVFMLASIGFVLTKMAAIGATASAVLLSVGIALSFTRWRMCTPLLGQLGFMVLALQEITDRKSVV